MNLQQMLYDYLETEKMAKITLDTVAGGYDLSIINNNFDKIETELNDKVLYRNNPVGEANTLETDVDVNAKRIYNLPEPLLDSEAARLQDVQNALAGGAANLIEFTPYGNISATNLQAAIQEEIDDLASTTSGKGASMVGYPTTGETVSTALDSRLPEIGTYMLLREYSGPVTAYYVRGVASLFDSGHGIFRVDSGDTTSADNGGTILVDALGRRWKREFVGPLHAAWFGVRGDGVTADKAAIDLASAAAVARSGVLKFHAGTFLYAGRWTITGAERIVIEGEGEATVFQSTDRTTNTDWHLHFTGDYITLRNFRVDGEKAALSSPVTERYGVYVNGLWTELDGVIIHDTINNATSLNGTRGVRVIRSTIRDIGYDSASQNTIGILTGAAEQTTIVGNTVYNCGRTGIMAFNAQKVTITGNNVDSCENGIRVDKTTWTDPNYAVISGNTVTNGYGDGIRFSGNYVTVTGNLCHGNSGNGLNSEGGSNQVVSGNTSTGNTQNGLRVGSAAAATEKLTITGNTLTGNTANGIFLNNTTAAATDVVIVGNNLTGNTDRAIRLGNAGADSTLFHANNNYLAGNIVMSSTGWTITAPGAYQTTLTAAATITATGAGTHGVGGTADIDNITILPLGTEITLYFTAAAATNGMRDGVGNLRLAGNFLYANNATIKLVSNGTTWLEVSRSIN